MTIFDQTYWDLDQASLWIVFRNAELVEESVPPINRRVPTMLMYSRMNDYEQVGTIIELSKTLELGNLYAYGRPTGGNTQVQQIPTVEWSSLILDAPIAYILDPKRGKIQPWTDITVKSADIKKEWPAEPKNTKHRELFDWEAIKMIWSSLEKGAQKPRSGRQLVRQIQDQFGKETSLTPPSRSQIEKHIKQWQLADLDPEE
jgi:hypothetical protein|tara:strand:- start:8 stop:613 length:606 start_codon:yes stop_codon:yes gene_type:complete